MNQQWYCDPSATEKSDDVFFDLHIFSKKYGYLATCGALFKRFSTHLSPQCINTGRSKGSCSVCHCIAVLLVITLYNTEQEHYDFLKTKERIPSGKRGVWEAFVPIQHYARQVKA